MPESPVINLFRKLAPKSLRNSAFYARYSSMKLPFVANEDPAYEKLIQDWEVPWKHSEALLSFVLGSVDLAEKPLMVAPLQVPASVTNYPMKPNELYLNLGSYSFVKKLDNKPLYYHTMAIDEFCFSHQGIKMLYSTTFMKEAAFNDIYGGKEYKVLKQKYDPQGSSPTLYEKAVRAS